MSPLQSENNELKNHIDELTEKINEYNNIEEDLIKYLFNII